MASHKLSYTASYIAIKFYGLTLDERIGNHFSTATKNFYRNLVAFLPSHLSWYQNSLSKSFWRKLFIASEELLLPGDLMHIICRKYYIEQLIDEALSEGISQVVVLGAGFDHNGKFKANEKATFFDIDTPYMVEQKEDFLRDFGYKNSNHHVCSIDVEEQNLVDVLTHHPDFDSTKPTLYLAEGFFDYLSLSTTKQVLEQMRSLTPNHQLVTTLFALEELNFFYRSSFTSGVAMVGETLKLPLNRTEFIQLMKDHQYTLQQEISHQQMYDDLVCSTGLNLPVMKGFYILTFK